MVAVPAAAPVTTPEIPTGATAVALLLHEPLGVASLSDVVLPSHTVVAPMIGERALTVTVTVAMQPVVVVYFITAVPVDIPDTTPVDPPTTATDRFRLLQVPP